MRSLWYSCHGADHWCDAAHRFKRLLVAPIREFHTSQMTTFSRCVFAVSTTSLDDVPSGQGSPLSLDYLIAWTSLWDPRILVSLGYVPEWRRSDTSGLDLEDAMVVCPELSRDRIDQPLEERLRAGGNALIPSARRPRPEVVAEIVATLAKRLSSAEPDSQSTATHPVHATDAEPQQPVENKHLRHPTEVPDLDCALLEDFYAFGYAVMQVQVMARKLRYSFNLDWMIVSDQILNAARASIEGNREETDRWLAAAFDSISQERDRYCSQQGNVLELVLTTPSTVGASLSNQLQVERPITLYATTKTLQRCRDTNPEGWSQLVRRLSDGSISLAGGLRDEWMHGYLTEDGLVRAFQDGALDYASMGLDQPKTWMRFQSGITGNLPTIARQFGYVGAIIAAFNGGTIPEKEHAKVRWQSHNESPAIDCILGHVLDAADAESVLSLGAEMAKQLDYHQVPTMVLAHWPAQKNPAFDDLVRAMNRTPAIGKWIDANTYFATTSQPYWTDNYGSKEFRNPLPSDASHLNALHQRLVEYTRCIHRLERLAAANRLWDWVPRAKGAAAIQPASSADIAAIDTEIQKLLRECDERAGATHTSASDPARGADEAGLADSALSEIAQKIDALQSRVFASIRSRIPGTREFVVINPTSHPQRVFLSNLPKEVDSASSTRIIAADATIIQSHEPSGPQGTSASMDAILDVPPFGFAKWRSKGGSHASTTPSSSTTAPKTGWLSKVFGGRSAIAQNDGTLANEFMELQIDPVRGHLRSMYVANKRGNRLSGMVAIVPHPLDPHHKLDDSSFLQLENVTWSIAENSKVRGTIEVQGTIRYPSGVTTSEATAAQTSRISVRYTLWMGARWVDIEVLGDDINLHRCYPVWRMVWASEAATIAAWQNGMPSKWGTPLQGTIELIEIDDAEHKIHFATGGLSFHRRLGANRLVSALPVRPTGRSHSRFALGMDWPRAWETAIDRTCEPWVLVPSDLPSEGQAISNATPTVDSGAWLAQCNMPNVRFNVIDPAPPLVVSKDPPGSTSSAVSDPSIGPDPSGGPDSSHGSDSEKTQGITVSLDTATEQTVAADACFWLVETSGRSGTAKLSCLKNIVRGWRVDYRGYECDKLRAEDGELLVPVKAWERSRIAVIFGD